MLLLSICARSGYSETTIIVGVSSGKRWVGHCGGFLPPSYYNIDNNVNSTLLYMKSILSDTSTTFTLPYILVCTVVSLGGDWGQQYSKIRA